MFVDVGHHSHKKSGQSICGDVFKVKLIPEQHRHVVVLSDGLGSGIKANIMASMTATMAIRFVESDRDMMQSLGVMMSALPICQLRKISYATFSIVDIAHNGFAKIMEMGNPECILLRSGKAIKFDKTIETAPQWQDRAIAVSQGQLCPGDRLIVMSDGVTQAGIGRPDSHLGWKLEGVINFVEEMIAKQPDIDAHSLSRIIVGEARRRDVDRCRDDITCGVIGYRQPQAMLVATGPAFRKENDPDYARIINEFKGCRVICGGTSANIVARELGLQIRMDYHHQGLDLPPLSTMEGFELITEGLLTLTRVVEYLEQGLLDENNPAGQLVQLFIKHDVIEFLVGTRINEAHHDPALNQNLAIRRNIIKDIADVLVHKYQKETKLHWI